MTNELEAALNFIPLDDGQRGPQITEFIGDVLTADAAQDEKYDRVKIVLVFENLDKIIAAPGQAFEFPVFDITVGIPKIGQRGSASRTNAYAALVGSAQKLLPELKSFRELKGKRLKMGYTDGHTLYNKDKGEYQGKAWEVLEVVSTRGNGVAATGIRDAEEIALALIDGKTRSKWQIEAYKNDSIKSVLSMKILNGKLIEEWESAGKITKADDGTYTVVK